MEMLNFFNAYSHILNEDKEKLEEMYIIDNWYNKKYSIEDWKSLNLSKKMVDVFLKKMNDEILTLENLLEDTSWFDGTNTNISSRARIANKNLYEQDQTFLRILKLNFKNFSKAYNL